jgi:hypothetical protein
MRDCALSRMALRVSSVWDGFMSHSSLRGTKSRHGVDLAPFRSEPKTARFRLGLKFAHFSNISASPQEWHDQFRNTLLRGKRTFPRTLNLEVPFGSERLVPSNWQEGEAPSEPGLSRPPWLRPWRSFALPQFPPERGRALKNLFTWF